MKEKDLQDLEVIFFTTMPTLHLLKPFGIPAHHIAGPKYFKAWIRLSGMHFLRKNSPYALETHQPSMFIFDGAFPYRLAC